MKIIAKVQKNNTTIRLSIDKSIVDLYKLKEMGPEERLEIIIVRKINLNEFDKEWEEKSKLPIEEMDSIQKYGQR